MLEWLIYSVIGIAAGLCSGLLGLGGGIVIVPALLLVFSWQGLPADQLMHIAIATSLMTIVITALASIYSHHKNNSINWTIVSHLTPGLIVGSILGVLFATSLASPILQRIFAAYLLITAINISFPRFEYANSKLLNRLVLLPVASGIGLISALMGIGGGSLVVPYLLMAKQSIRCAIATAAACGFAIAIAAVVAFLLLSYYQTTNSREWQQGFIYWPAFFGIISTSLLFSIIGAHGVAILPINRIKRLFSIALIISALTLIWV